MMSIARAAGRRSGTFSPLALAASAVLALAASAVPVRPASAQSVERPPVMVGVHADTVVLHLTESAPSFGGFVVYREAPGEGAVRLTDAPLRPSLRPSTVRATLGEAWDDVLRAARVADGGELIQRLRSDRFAAELLGLLYPGVGRVLGRRFEDPGHGPGEEVVYRIASVDADGVESEGGFTIRVQVEDRVPAPPAVLEIEAGDGAAQLTWSYAAYEGDPRDVVVGFHVERADGPGGAFRRVTTTPMPRAPEGPFTFVDNALDNDAAYRYRIRAVDMLGREGEPGAPVEVRPRDETAPAPPRELESRPGDGEVLLVWRASPEPDVAGYRVERRSRSDTVYVRLSDDLVPALEPGWYDTTAVGGVQYFYRITAVDQNGNASRPSNPHAVVPDDHTPPSVPTGLEAEVVDRRIRLRWQPSPSPDVVGYHISRGAVDGRLVRLTPEPVAESEYVDAGFGGEGLNPGTRYRLAVVAVDGVDNISDTLSVEVTIPDDEAPGAPSGLSARNVGGRYVRLSWTASPASDVARYELSRSRVDVAGGAEVVVLGAFAADAPRATRDSAFVRGGEYVYRLVAIDGAGNRSEATVDTLRIRRPTPPPPPRHALARMAETGVEITWERVVDKELIGYHVYRSTLPTGVYERLTDEPLTTLRHMDPEGTAQHFYVVRAIDRSGNESGRSPAVSPEGG